MQLGIGNQFETFMGGAKILAIQHDLEPPGITKAG
jgi:hypothetical protein